MSERRLNTAMLVAVENGHTFSGLFRVLPRNQERGRLDVTWRSRDGALELQWRGVEALGEDDRSVLLALVWLCSHDHAGAPDVLAASTPSKSLVVAGEPSVPLPTARRDTTVGEICRALGRADGGQDRKQVLASLRRLAETTVWLRDRRRDAEGATRLVGWRRIGDRLRVELDPGLSAVLVGQAGWGFGVHDLRERASLRGDVARSVHAWLSQRVRPGATVRVTWTALERAVWPEPVPERRAAHHRRERLRAAVDSLACCGGWWIERDAEGLTVERYAQERS